MSVPPSESWSDYLIASFVKTGKPSQEPNSIAMVVFPAAGGLGTTISVGCSFIALASPSLTHVVC